MGYNQYVTDCTAVLPPENFEETLSRLAALGVNGHNRLVSRPPHALNAQEALADIGWDTSVDDRGAIHLDCFTGDWPTEQEILALAEIGDLFEPDGLIGWSGEDNALWGWRLNYRGHSFTEVSAHAVYDDVPPAEDLTSPAGDLLVRCAYAVDEACDVLTGFAEGTKEGHEVGDLLEVLFDARRELLAAARPELREEWEKHESAARRLGRDSEASDEERELARDRREDVYRTICEEARWSHPVSPASPADHVQAQLDAYALTLGATEAEAFGRTDDGYEPVDV